MLEGATPLGDCLALMVEWIFEVTKISLCPALDQPFYSRCHFRCEGGAAECQFHHNRRTGVVHIDVGIAEIGPGRAGCEGQCRCGRTRLKEGKIGRRLRVAVAICPTCAPSESRGTRCRDRHHKLNSIGSGHSIRRHSEDTGVGPSL